MKRKQKKATPEPQEESTCEIIGQLIIVMLVAATISAIIWFTLVGIHATFFPEHQDTTYRILVGRNAQGCDYTISNHNWYSNP